MKTKKRKLIIAKLGKVNKHFVLSIIICNTFHQLAINFTKPLGLTIPEGILISFSFVDLDSHGPYLLNFLVEFTLNQNVNVKGKVINEK